MWIKRIVLAVCVAFLVFLICLLVGTLLVVAAAFVGPFGVFFAALGGFLVKWAIGIGFVFGVLALVSGRTTLGFWPWR